MITLGIDAGTKATKAVLTNHTGTLASVVLPCGRESTVTIADLARRDVLAKAGLSPESVTNIGVTGLYGDRVSFATNTFPEGVCLAKAMGYMKPSVHSVLDVGSVRALAIKCQDGRLTSISVNDRCASGTGAFVEVLASFFRVPIAELGNVALTAKEPVDFLNTCAVYVESEALSLMVEGKTAENIIAGALRGFSSRILSLLMSIGVEPDIAMVGGLANNKALVKNIEESLGLSLFIPEEPQTALAFGAALLAQGKE